MTGVGYMSNQFGDYIYDSRAVQNGDFSVMLTRVTNLLTNEVQLDASIYQYLGNKEDIVIPRTVAGYTVTEIATNAFLGNKNIIREDIMQRKTPVPHTIKEVTKAKTAADVAIFELLELLPKDDARCGMVHVLGEWLRSEIDLVPDDINYVDPIHTKR